MATRTGNLGIGFRRFGSDWQQDLNQLVEWTKANGFEAIDLGRDADQHAKTVIDAGLRIGSVDLAEWEGMLSPDAGKRKAAVARNAEYIRQAAAAGPLNHFLVMLPEDPARPRAENFGYMVESFSELAPVLAENRAKLVIEGWPGAGALCCTPETYRAFFKECPAPGMGINFDPSHLIRMGIDPLRFLREFGSRVYHIHGKDCAVDDEALYDLGYEQPPTFAKGVGFGSATWRYCIPGHGRMDWSKGFEILAAHGYAGCVSIELEDGNFNGQDEQGGLNFARKFLEGA